MGENEQKWAKISKNGQKWVKMGKNEQFWLKKFLGEKKFGAKKFFG